MCREGGGGQVWGRGLRKVAHRLWHAEDAGRVGEEGEDFDVNVAADEALEDLELEPGVVVEKLG